MNIKRRLFAAIAEKKHVGQGWPLAFVSGNSISDFKDWSIETLSMKADEVPEVCADAATFSQLVAGLLNAYYNSVDVTSKTEDEVMCLGKQPAALNIPHPINTEIPFS